MKDACGERTNMLIRVRMNDCMSKHHPGADSFKNFAKIFQLRFRDKV